MHTSVRWLNRYLEPADLTPDEAEHTLTFLGFPIESRETLPDGDTRLDVELTSNRGDCLCHFGLAREIAAATGRRLLPPKSMEPARDPTSAAKVTSVDNQLAKSGGCPRFTTRVIRGVKIGPSPAWLAQALESIGHRPINNVVDASNFVLFELGQPSHTFDMKKLAGERIIVRDARAGETLVALDGRKHTLAAGDMVVADSSKAVGLAGIIGGLDTSVTNATTEVLLEAATWDPVRVRRTARRLEIRTDASHRYERIVDARGVEDASLRIARLIVELAGGNLLDGVVDAAAALAAPTTIRLRAQRCRDLLGVDVPTDAMVKALTALGIGVERHKESSDEVLRCTIPHHRPDLGREVDLIEEVGRVHGFDKIRTTPAVSVNLAMRQPPEWGVRERAMEELSRALTGAGFYETVTFTFQSREHAEPYLRPGQRLLRVEEARRKDDPFLRPSLIPSLLTCRRANQDAGANPEGGVRLFETASTFSEEDDGKKLGRRTLERRTLSLLADARGPSRLEALQDAVRLVRGAIECAARALGGSEARVECQPVAPPVPALREESCARILLAGKEAGWLATLLGPSRIWGLETPAVGAEIDLMPLIGLYPPKAGARALPRFPAAWRDLSLVVDEKQPWARFDEVISALALPNLEGREFVGVFRGKQIGQGRKSVTLRLVFRHPERTLRNEEVDDHVGRAVERLSAELKAELRGPVSQPAG